MGFLSKTVVVSDHEQYHCYFFFFFFLPSFFLQRRGARRAPQRDVLSATPLFAVGTATDPCHFQVRGYIPTGVGESGTTALLLSGTSCFVMGSIPVRKFSHSRRDSNPRSSGHERSALPHCATTRPLIRRLAMFHHYCRRLTKACN